MQKGLPVVVHGNWIKELTRFEEKQKKRDNPHMAAFFFADPFS